MTLKVISAWDENLVEPLKFLKVKEPKRCVRVAPVWPTFFNFLSHFPPSIGESGARRPKGKSLFSIYLALYYACVLRLCMCSVLHVTRQVPAPDCFTSLHKIACNEKLNISLN